MALIAGALRPRLATTLAARGDRFTYTEAKIGGEVCLECSLREIQVIEHEPWDGDSGGKMWIVTRGSGRRQLFTDLDAKEVDAIAGALLPIWKAAGGGAA